MTRKYPLAIALVAVAAGGALASGSAGQEQTPPDSLELEYRHREARVAFVDEPPRMTKRRPSESPGDSAISRGTLRNGAGEKVGTAHAQFLITGGRGEKTSEQATVTFVLADGQITAQGIFDNAGGSDVDVIAITGGTGRYDGARGNIRVTSGRQAVGFALDFAR